jgi:hypothetical protein
MPHGGYHGYMGSSKPKPFVSKPSAPPGEKGGGGYVKPKSFVSKPSAPPGEKGGGGYVAPSKPKQDVKSLMTSDKAYKVTVPKKTKKVIVDTPGDTGREKGIKKAIVLGGAASTSLLAGAGAVKAKRTIADIRKINKWADRTSRMFGKTYSQLGRKINPALMARTSGEFVPSKIFSKTGYPSGIKNWWMARSSPKHFAGAEKFVNPALKLFTQSIAKIVGPASWLITSSGAGEQELQWEREK